MPLLQPETTGALAGSRVAGDATDAAVWLCLLGGFRLVSRGQAVAVRSGGKTEALLVHLGLAGLRGIPREVLLQTIWPDRESSLAGQALNSLVHSLKTLLHEALRGAEPVIPRDGQYRLNEAAGFAVDVAQFRALVDEGERLHLQGQDADAMVIFQRAAHLYGGDLSLAAGTSGRVALERERLRATFRRVLIRLADEAFARDAFEASLEHALALLAHDPCREDAHRLVMRCHVRLGERSQAMRHYEAVRQILRAELDAEPEPATTALFEHIRLNPGAV
jgi:DNA-binding SARP family transcriptional activator